MSGGEESTGPRNARSQGSQRYYPWRGINYFSVTTLIDGGTPKFPLRKWGIKMVAEGALRNRAVLRAMLDECETPELCTKVRDMIDLCPKCNQTVRYLKDLPYAFTQRAQDIGTFTHNAVEAYQLGKPMPPWPVAIRPRMTSFERFLADWAPVFEMSEATVYHRLYQYAGTLDSVFLLEVARVTPLVLATLPWDQPEGDRIRVLADWKTSARGIYSEVAMQLAAYRNAEFVGMPDGSEIPMLPVHGALAISLTDEGYRLVPVDTGPEVFRAFLHAKEVFRFDVDISKRVLYPDLLLPPAVAA
jgi:hypothetical protein